jgi:hypothetical protein
MLRILRHASLWAGCLIASLTYAHPAFDETQGLDGLGQVINIHTRLDSTVGKAIWTLIIRDLDTGQNIPYIFDFIHGDNHWVAFTFSRNYLITASRLQIVVPRSRYNQYKNYRISNFCNIESMGRIVRGRSMVINLKGDLSPNRDKYTCIASSFPDGPTFIAKPE